ncbi:MAG: Hsp20/alpha crystallin family protein [Actinobacteria bacterium]|nr:Hsp20/alpha crystallin family protein [Actinomycetota bacterium]
MLMRFDPFRELDRWAPEVAGNRPSVVPMDAYRHGDHFTVHFDLPGIDPSSIDLTVDKDVLTVSARRSWEPDESQEVLIAERPQGTFTRQLFLGDNLDAEHVEAGCDQGVLTVTIPVAESAKPRKVEITSGDGAAKEITAESSESQAA